jgi:molybdenum cofactor biosynthesis enzyme MoaA
LIKMNTGSSLKEWKKYSGYLGKDFGGRQLRHCWALNGSQISVTPGFLKACGSSTHAKGSPIICEYNTPNVNPEIFLTGLGNIIRDNQTESGPCVGCRYLSQTNMRSNFVSDYISSISLHDFCGCNSQCVYCSGSEYHLPEKYVATFDHGMLFDYLLKAGLIKPELTSVSWGGGEPTLLNTFENTVNFLRTNRIRQTINTSGILYSEAIEKTLNERLSTVRISVDSGTNEAYYRVKRNRFCDDVWESVRRYASTGGDFILKYIILAMNSDAEEIERFIRRSREAGVKYICISVDARSVHPHAHATPGVEKITLKELAAAVLMRNQARANNIESYFESIWLPDHIARIEQIGNFRAKPGLMFRVSRRIKPWIGYPLRLIRSYANR